MPDSVQISGKQRMSDETIGPAQGLRASELMRDASALNRRPGDRCRLTQVSIQDGLELQLWEAAFASPLQMDIVEDSERIHFTYVTQGAAGIEMANRRFGGELAAMSGSGVVHACPGEKGRFRQAGNYSSVVAMLRPEVFFGWREAAATGIREAVAQGRCLVGGVKGTALQRQAWRLHRALGLGASDSGAMHGSCHSLHLHAQGLNFVAAFLDCLSDEPDQRPRLSREDRHRLQRARDLLLADLARAPTLAELAAASGLGLVKLKRGFRAMFGNSVYGLFMQERMHAARRRLLSDKATVTEVASDLGYTNISHFAAAFRKQFGVNPGTFRG